MKRKPQPHECHAIDFGLVCGNVPKIDVPEHRGLALLLQFLSWQPGGLATVAEALVNQYAERIGSEAMREIGAASGQVYTDQQAAVVRWELFSDPEAMLAIAMGADYESTCRAGTFHALALSAARRRLAEDLRDVAGKTPLQPPCYFWELAECLQDWAAMRRSSLAAELADTWQARQILQLFNFAFDARGVSVGLGPSGIGKSAVAMNWCAQHPERARYVEVPETDDLRKLQRAVAHALGLHGWGDYPPDRLADEATAALVDGEIGLVLDEAHRLWPAARRKPSRVEWVHGLINRGVPMAMLGIGEDFRLGMGRAGGYGYAVTQFNKRREMALDIQTTIGEDDICRVLAKKLPEIPLDKLTALGRGMVGLAGADDTGFGAAVAVAKRARYLAGKSAPTVREVKASIAARHGEAGLFDLPEDFGGGVIAGERPINEVLEHGGRGSAPPVIGGRIAAPADSLAIA